LGRPRTGELNDSLSRSARFTLLLADYGQRSIKADHYGHPTAKINRKGTPPLCPSLGLRYNFSFCR
jgi:hypothetical protein